MEAVSSPPRPGNDGNGGQIGHEHGQDVLEAEGYGGADGHPSVQAVNVVDMDGLRRLGLLHKTFLSISVIFGLVLLYGSIIREILETGQE